MKLQREGGRVDVLARTRRGVGHAVGGCAEAAWGRERVPGTLAPCRRVVRRRLPESECKSKRETVGARDPRPERLRRRWHRADSFIKR